MATRISAPLPDLDLEGLTVLRVSSGATISRIVIHVSQAVPELPTTLADVQPIFAYAPDTSTEAPGVTR